MKPFKTLGSVLLSTSALFLATSCSKNVDEQLAKGDQQIETLMSGGCDPFVGVRMTQNDAMNTYVYFGNFKSPLETQAFYMGDFTASNLLLISGTGGAPMHNPQNFTLGVGSNFRVDPGEVLSLLINGNLAGKAANKAVLQTKGNNAVGTADFYLSGMLTGSMPLSSGAFEFKAFEYSATGSTKEFDEVRISVSSGWLSLSGFVPAASKSGPTGFYLVEEPGNALIGRFQGGTTTIGMTAYQNQFFAYLTNYVLGPSSDRQNRMNVVSNMPTLVAGAGEFPTGMSRVIPGSMDWVNITGWSGGMPTTLGYASSQYRWGVGDQVLNAGEMIEITPGPAYTATTGKTTWRSVEVREAHVTSVASVGPHIMKITAWMGMNPVATINTQNIDQAYTLLTSTKDFNKVTIEHVSGVPSIGRVNAGGIGQAISLTPGCN